MDILIGKIKVRLNIVGENDENDENDENYDWNEKLLQPEIVTQPDKEIILTKQQTPLAIWTNLSTLYKNTISNMTLEKVNATDTIIKRFNLFSARFNISDDETFLNTYKKTLFFIENKMKNNNLTDTPENLDKILEYLEILGPDLEIFKNVSKEFAVSTLLRGNSEIELTKYGIAFFISLMNMYIENIDTFKNKNPKLFELLEIYTTQDCSANGSDKNVLKKARLLKSEIDIIYMVIVKFYDTEPYNKLPNDDSAIINEVKLKIIQKLKKVQEQLPNNSKTMQENQLTIITQHFGGEIYKILNENVNKTSLFSTNKRNVVLFSKID